MATKYNNLPIELERFHEELINHPGKIAASFASAADRVERLGDQLPKLLSFKLDDIQRRIISVMLDRTKILRKSLSAFISVFKLEEAISTVQKDVMLKMLLAHLYFFLSFWADAALDDVHSTVGSVLQVMERSKSTCEREPELARELLWKKEVAASIRRYMKGCDVVELSIETIRM